MTSCAASLACRSTQPVLVADLCGHEGEGCTDAVVQGVQDAVHQGCMRTRPASKGNNLPVLGQTGARISLLIAFC